MHWNRPCVSKFFLNRGSQSPLPMLVGGIKLAIERLLHVTNLCSLSIFFVVMRTSFNLLLKQRIVYIRRDILWRRAIGFLEGHELKTVARLIEKRFCKTVSLVIAYLVKIRVFSISTSKVRWPSGLRRRSTFTVTNRFESQWSQRTFSNAAEPPVPRNYVTLRVEHSRMRRNHQFREITSLKRRTF